MTFHLESYYHVVYNRPIAANHDVTAPSGGCVGKLHLPFCSWEILAWTNVGGIPAVLLQVMAWVLPHNVACTCLHPHWQDSQKCLERESARERRGVLKIFQYCLRVDESLLNIWCNIVLYLDQCRPSGSAFCSTLSVRTGFCDLQCVCSTLWSLQNILDISELTP